MIFSFVFLNYLFYCHAKVLLFFQIAKILLLFLVLNFHKKMVFLFRHFGTRFGIRKNFFFFFSPYQLAIHKIAGGGDTSAFGVFRPHAEALSTI